MATYYEKFEDPPSYDQMFPTAPPGPETISSQGFASVQIQEQQPQLQNPNILQNYWQLPPLGPKPCSLTCPYCQQQQTTTIRKEIGSKTHMFALILCLLGGLVCVWIPYVLKSLKYVRHYCSNCDRLLGTYND